MSFAVRSLSVLLLALGGAAFAGEPPRVVLDGGAEVRTPYEIGVVTGRLEGATSLRVSVRQTRYPFTFETPVGTDAIAFSYHSVGPLFDPGHTDRMRARLAALDVRDAAVVVGERTVETVRLPSTADDRLPEVLAAMGASPASLRLRVQVLPQYAESESTPPRLMARDPSARPWPGNEAEFHAFLAAEIDQWRVRGKGPYVPSRPGFALVRRAGATGDDASNFVLVEEPRSGEESFDGTTFESVRFGRDSRGQAVLLLEVAAERRRAFRAFTERNLFLPVAIVVNGELLSAPIIQSPLDGQVQISLGNRSRAESEREARDLASRLHAGVGGGRALQVAPAAVLRLAPDGRFQVSVPLWGDVTVELLALGADAAAGATVVEIRRSADAVPTTDEAVLAWLALEAWGRPQEAAVVAGPLDTDEGPPLEAAALGSPHAGDSAVAMRRWTRWLSARPEEASKAVASLLRSPASSEVSLWARRIEALREIVPYAMSAVEAALKDPMPDVREAAVLAVGQSLRDEAGLRLLVAALRDESPRVRVGACQGIAGSFGLFHDREMDPSTVSAPLLRELVEVLSKAVGTEGEENAAIALGRLGRPGEAALLTFATSTDAGVREAAFGGLGVAESKSPEALAAAVRGMEDPHPRVRLSAAVAHRAMGGPVDASARALARVAGDASLDVPLRVGALFYLHMPESPGDVGWSATTERLQDPNDLVRRAAALLLASAGRADEATRRLAEETRSNPPKELSDFLGGLRNLEQVQSHNAEWRFNFGNHTRMVTTSVPEAQKAFDRGLVLSFAFSHGAAEKEFRRAAELDPTCAMAWWGIALVNGPHINFPLVLPENAQAAWEALERAKANAARASETERALIGALEKRYANPQPEDRRPLDEAYAAAMREVANAHPRDADVATLLAEALMDLHPWDLWKADGEAQPWTPEILDTIERAMELDGMHPGAHHLYVHAIESSPAPEKGLPSADLLRDLVPGAGHLVHMPAHIYGRVGRWADAAAANVRAIEADAHYRTKHDKPGFYSVYMAHNHHFLAFTAMMRGRSAEALASARAMVAGIPAEFLAAFAPIADGFMIFPSEVLMRFGRWEEILAEPEPAETLPLSRALWRFTRAVALNALGRAEDAAKERKAFRDAVKKVPPEWTFGNNPASTILGVASHVLDGEVDAKAGRFESAVASLREAVKLEDSMKYDEPPDWIQPVRHTLGAALMTAKRPAEAEVVYREDLVRWPENAWSLLGLARSLHAQGKHAAAHEADARAKKAWADADIQADSTCLCLPGK